MDSGRDALPESEMSQSFELWGRGQVGSSRLEAFASLKGFLTTNAADFLHPKGLVQVSDLTEPLPRML